MAQDPRGVWAVMPHPHPRPRRRRPPGAGEAKKLESPVSSKTVGSSLYGEGCELQAGKGAEVLAHLPHSPAGLVGSALTVCSLFAVPAATCHQSASPRCAAKTLAVAPHPLAATVAPKRKGKCRRRGPVTDGGARTSDRHQKYGEFRVRFQATRW